MKRTVQTIAQVLLLIALSKLSDAIAEWLPISIPGSVIGIALLFALLRLRIVHLSWIDAGASFLLAEMLLFFIPSTVGILNYKGLIATNGPAILLTIILSTTAVMACTGLVAERLEKRKGRPNPNGAAKEGAVV
ncbi:CidA/LrgA family protein [Paenibacillus sp. NPDC058071]|uniref:CidA/LrgA family protein n=1 Tax=Paenibacillus sp. NPDC058071 TaxID=3346326 RepID=UPI0036DF8828